jgi:hypothetical protein
LIKRSWVSQNFETLEEELEMVCIAFGFKIPFFDKHLLAPKIGIMGRDFFGDKIWENVVKVCFSSVNWNNFANSLEKFAKFFASKN